MPIISSGKKKKKKKKKTEIKTPGENWKTVAFLIIYETVDYSVPNWSSKWSCISHPKCYVLHVV